jgi:ribosomal protein S8
MLQLKPGLNEEENHSIWMLVDGKPVIKNTQSLSLKLGRIERGAHKLQAQVRDKEGKIIVRTRTTIIYIHQASVP